MFCSKLRSPSAGGHF
uniref:Uncharacterized protein n=1 Tax=Anguilla anguilla TaxID=7936 RepID=A0A0E9UEU0_ANGAN